MVIASDAGGVVEELIRTLVDAGFAVGALVENVAAVGLGIRIWAVFQERAVEWQRFARRRRQRLGRSRDAFSTTFWQQVREFATIEFVIVDSSGSAMMWSRQAAVARPVVARAVAVGIIPIVTFGAVERISWSRRMRGRWYALSRRSRLSGAGRHLRRDVANFELGVEPRFWWAHSDVSDTAAASVELVAAVLLRIFVVAVLQR